MIILRSAHWIISVFSAHCQEETKLKWIRGMARVTLVNVNANGIVCKGVARTKPGDSGDGICVTLRGKIVI